MKTSSSNKLRFVDLFAGIGGIRLAFEAAGCECVFSSEWDKYAQKTYSANFGEVPHGDITKIDAGAVPPFDILTAGFPCQPFSSIGKREGFSHPTQGTLFYDVVRLISHHRPSAFLLENVRGLMTHDGGNTLKLILQTIEELGYDVWYQVLDAAQFGVPQHRDRIYLVGMRVDEPRQPIIAKGSRDSVHLWQHEVTQRRFTFPSPQKTNIKIGELLESGVLGHSISKHLQQVYLFKLDDGRPEIIDKSTDFPVKTLVASYHKIQRLTGTFVRGGETGIRLLTAHECKAIMGFPSDFKIPVSRTQMYRQLGNSVAVPVVTAIAKQLTKALRSEAASNPSYTLEALAAGA